MANERDNFSQPIKRALADRAGGVCSFPGCNQATTGPSLTDPNRGIQNGIAAHIHAAAPGGPRYDPLQSEQVRRSIDNGIWMCPTHGSLMDKEDTAFTADQIRQWKTAAEQRARQRLELSGTNAAAQPAYSPKDCRILHKFAELMPYDHVMKLKTQIFGAIVPTDQIDRMYSIRRLQGNPEYEFSSPQLNTLRNTLNAQIDLFHQHFSRQSAGNVGYYDYISLAEWSRSGPASRAEAIEAIAKAELLAHEACDTLLVFLQIKSNLS